MNDFKEIVFLNIGALDDLYKYNKLKKKQY